MADDLARMIAERNAAFESDDLEWAKLMMEAAKGAPVDPLIVKMGFHKARYECLHVSEKKRRESQAWLAASGVKSMAGLPVKLGDPLPT